MTGKKTKTLKREKLALPNKKILMLSVVFAIAVIISAVAYKIFLLTPEPQFSFQAIIVDQVGETSPSTIEEARIFNETVNYLLENAGFNVTYYGSEKITVNFYRELAKNNYGLIILRVHSAIRNNSNVVDFFTSEEYVENNHADEVNKGLLTIGSYSWLPNKSYFAITPEFIRLEGNFPNSIIIAMGCSSLKCESMADAFIYRGAKAYVGWTGPVSIEYSDNSTIRFLQYFLSENRTIKETIDLCNGFPNPEYYQTRLAFYPERISNYVFSDFLTNIVLSVFSLNQFYLISKL